MKRNQNYHFLAALKKNKIGVMGDFVLGYNSLITQIARECSESADEAMGTKYSARREFIRVFSTYFEDPLWAENHLEAFIAFVTRRTYANWHTRGNCYSVFVHIGNDFSTINTYGIDSCLSMQLSFGMQQLVKSLMNMLKILETEATELIVTHAIHWLAGLTKPRNETMYGDAFVHDAIKTIRYEQDSFIDYIERIVKNLYIKKGGYLEVKVGTTSKLNEFLIGEFIAKRLDMKLA